MLLPSFTNCCKCCRISYTIGLYSYDSSFCNVMCMCVESFWCFCAKSFYFYYCRVSYYDITIDNAAPVRQKSSGIAVCTGTGSTSWFHSINRLSKHTVQAILQIGIYTQQLSREGLLIRIYYLRLFCS